MNLFGLFNGAAALAGGALLMAVGVALIVRSTHSRHDRLAERLELARSRAETVVAKHRPPRAAGAAVRAIPSTLYTPEAREVIRHLARLGIPVENAMPVYRVGRLLLAAIGAAFVLVVTLRLFPRPGMGLAVAAMGAAALATWSAPPAILRWLVRTRSARAANGLPDALELLVVCVEAGLSLEDGIERAVKELRHSQPELGEEFALTAADLKFLPSRDQALANLAARIDVPSVRSLVTTLSQTLRYGTPLAQAMRTIAAELREDALLRIEKRANELPVMLTIPMMLFIMPTIFLIVGGPAGLRIFDIFLR